MDITKLKVPDLKRELKARGLSAVGNKNELMERLQNALKNKTEDSAGGESVDDLEEDLLNVDDDEHLDGSESGITDIDSAMDITHGQKSQKRKSQDGIPNDQPKQVKKVVLNRTSSNTDVTHNNSTDDSIEKDKVDEKKVVKLSELSAKDRLEMRAKKFGVPLTVDAKRAVRAERFGTSSSKSISNNSTSVDVLKQRAERFGINVSSVVTKLDNDERIKRRQERFGKVAENTSQNNKKEERLQRFKQTV
ncbi:SAP domain [Popillia japonica]